jgi:hypothetical protein
MITTKSTRARVLAALMATMAGGAALLAAAPAGAATAVPAQSQAVAASTTLLPGQSLKAGQSITSANGVYSLQMGADGNVVLSRPGYPTAWASQTLRKGSVLVMQKNGDLVVVYGRTRVWASGTDGSTNAKLVVQNDGTLAIYNTRGKAVWNHHMVITTMKAPDALRVDRTLYSHNRVFQLQMRKNGDLVLLKSGTTVRWSSKTAGPGMVGSYALLTSGGSLNILRGDRLTIWSTKTNRPGAVLQLTDAGKANLVHGRTIIWTAG